MVYVIKLKNARTLVCYKSNSSQFVISVLGQIFSKKGYEGININFKKFFTLAQAGAKIDFNKNLKRLFLYKLGL
jgi:hypothetical protein